MSTKLPLAWLATAGTLAASACQSPAPPETDRTAASTNAQATSAATTASATTIEPTSSSAAPSASSAAPTKPLNVLLITVDSLRADMPWNGYERPIAPNLTRLAEQSTVYTNAYSVSSYTAKSVSSLLASRYPSSMYRSGWFFAGFSDANLFFTEVLQERGVRTMAGHAHMYFSRGKNLEQGFDVWELVPGIGFDSDTDKNITSDKMTKLAIEQLGKPENSKGQFFMWLHYMDPHDQYIQHEEAPKFGKNNRDRYDAEVFFTDLHLGKLFEYGAKQPWWEHTAIIISADHGEAFGEHGMFKHAFELWEVLTRVPLIIHVPGAAPRRITERRSDIDIAPTVLELMGVPEMPKSFVGQSLAKEVYGTVPPNNREPIILDLPEDKNNPDRHAIIQGDFKLLVYGPGTQSYRLFNLKTDPGELEDVSKKEPEKFAEMKALYAKTWEGLEVVEPFGGMELRSGRKANGPKGPPGYVEKKESGEKKETKE